MGKGYAWLSKAYNNMLFTCHIDRYRYIALAHSMSCKYLVEALQYLLGTTQYLSYVQALRKIQAQNFQEHVPSYIYYSYKVFY